MKSIALIFVFLGGAFAVTASDGTQAVSSDESLKATHQMLLQGVSSGNATMIAAVVHPQALGFFRESQQLVQLGTTVKPLDVVPPILADLGKFTTTPFSTAFRVIGDVGIVALTAAAVDKKGDDDKDRYLRSTYVYARAGDSWKLASWHTSDSPLLKK